MTANITHEDVMRVAREVFPGLTDENILIDGPDPDTGWCVTVRFGRILGFKVSCAAGSLSASGKGDHGVDLPLASLSSVAELRIFLHDCRDSLRHNLETMLKICLGPVRVLPKDETVDGLVITNFSFTSQHLAPQAGTSVGALLDAYATEVARRRAERAAKPAGS